MRLELVCNPIYGVFADFKSHIFWGAATISWLENMKYNLDFLRKIPKNKFSNNFLKADYVMDEILLNYFERIFMTTKFYEILDLFYKIFTYVLCLLKVMCFFNFTIFLLCRKVKFLLNYSAWMLIIEKYFSFKIKLFSNLQTDCSNNW